MSVTLAVAHCAERGVDVSGVQRVDLPTRDVLVVYDSNDDRQFVGFGGPNESFADTVISADQLPLDALRNSAALVTGTLGLNFPVTAEAMYKAVETAKAGSALVRLQSNTCSTPSLVLPLQPIGSLCSAWIPSYSHFLLACDRCW